MAKIAKNLLDCSRSEIPRKEKLNFHHVLDHSINSVKTDITVKNIQVTKILEDDIPLILDLGLERVLTNIIRNAVEAMPANGKLTVEVEYLHSNLIIKVSDTGTGIPVDIIDKIFEPFYTTKDMDKGCGLGLTIVSEIIKSYDGRIDVESIVGKGTTFTITIPMRS